MKLNRFYLLYFLKHLVISNNFLSLQSCGEADNSVLKLSSSNLNKSWGGVMSVRNSLKVRTQECLKSRKNEKNSAFNVNNIKKKNKRDLERLDSTDNTGIVKK